MIYFVIYDEASAVYVQATDEFPELAELVEVVGQTNFVVEGESTLLLVR